MCGRYNLEWNKDDEQLRVFCEQLQTTYANSPLLAGMKTGEIRPTNIVPALVKDRAAALLRWGYPKWDGKGQIINARSETAGQKPLFKQGRPCLLPASGYYEWAPAANGGKKTKYYFTQTQSPLMYLAGLYRAGREEDGLAECVILTRAADPGPDRIHDRMPVIVPPTHIDAWLKEKDAGPTVKADQLTWQPA